MEDVVKELQEIRKLLAEVVECQRYQHRVARRGDLRGVPEKGYREALHSGEAKLPEDSRLAISIDTDLDLSQRKSAARALDMLRGALADHGHTWTDEERGAYDEAIANIQDVRMSPTSSPCQTP